MILFINLSDRYYNNYISVFIDSPYNKNKNNNIDNNNNIDHQDNLPILFTYVSA